MAKKPESRRQRKIRQRLEEVFPDSKWVKIHGGWFQDAGLLDLHGCVYGLHCELEVKEPDGELSPLQIERIYDILNAGGCAAEVLTEEQAVNIVYGAIRKAGFESKAGMPSRDTQKIRVYFLRARSRKDSPRTRNCRTTRRRTR